MDRATIDSEFLHPLVAGWLSKLEAATRSRKDWKECADECMMFYNRSAEAMWNPTYSKKFWRGAKLPRFRITINKAFEMVAIFGPSLLWETPHRTVNPRRKMDLPVELLMQDPQFAPMIEMLQQQEQADQVRDKAISTLMDRWLNYTPHEQPGGGLVSHSWRCTIDALLKGRGVLAAKPYKMPASGRTLTGAFRYAPEDLFIDPDFNSLEEARWIAIRHVDTRSEVEKRFQLPKDALKGKAMLESSWHYAELANEGSQAHRKEGLTHDLVVWYEIFSKAGCGVTNTSVDATIREHMDGVIGQYAYIAICADVKYPLNMHTEQMRRGATDDQVKQSFQWPVPFWADDRWPVETLDFYLNPDSAWPIPPLAPGLGELKLLNFLVSWFANRTWSSSRDFWAVAQPYLEHYKDYINNSEDQAIIPTPVGLKSPKEAIEILTQPESRQDMGKLIEFVSDMFDRRVGLTATAYGQNEGGTQNRTAEETVSKQRNVSVRPEFMQKQVVDWQTRVASAEAFVARWFVTGNDVMSLLGPTGGIMWDKFVASTDVEHVVRQFEYSIGAASIRRPNRDRDIGNYQQVMALFAQPLAAYGQQTANYAPWNAMVSEWARLHDTNLDEVMVPVPPPPSPEEEAQQQAVQQQAQELEFGKLQAEISKLEADAQLKMTDAQLKPQEAQMQAMQMQMQMQMEQLRQQGEATRQQYEQAKAQTDIAMKEAEARLKAEMKQIEMEMKRLDKEQEMLMKQQQHALEMQQDQQEHEQEIEQSQDEADTKLLIMTEEAIIQQQIDKQKAEAQIELTKQQAKAQASAQAKAKPQQSSQQPKGKK
jgi:hypothetical protein